MVNTNSSHQSVRILVVDDSSPTREWLRHELAGKYELIFCRNCAEAYERLRAGPVDLIWLEQLLPDSSGLDFVRQLQADPAYSKIPIILATRVDEPTLILEAFRAGCEDFIHKPLAIEEIHGRIEKCLERRTLTQHYRRSLQELKLRAERDMLTGLLNRQSFIDAGRKELAKSQRTGHPVALLLIDLDNFKIINDVYGHLAGDYVLANFGALLASSARSYDIVGRYGGDEFIIILPHSTADQACKVAEKILRAVEGTSFIYRTRALAVSPSIGIASSNDSGITTGPNETLEAMIARADEALYAAKRAGKNQIALAPEASKLE